MSGYLPTTREPRELVASSPVVIVSGFVITVLGIVYDSRWHAQGGADHVVLIPPGHAVIMIGTVLLLAGSVLLYKRSAGRLRQAAGVAAVGAGGSLTGRIVDEVLHTVGVHGTGLNLAVHLVDKVGLLLFIVAIVVAALFWIRGS